MEKVSRRNFLLLTGVAGTALTLSACSQPVEKLIPFLNQPQYPKPGEWTYIAASCRECPAGCGMLLSYRDGRITKAEGNPLHPLNRGKLCPRGQSSLQGLYDPDRLREVSYAGADNKRFYKDWQSTIKLIAEKIRLSKKVYLISDLQTGTLKDLFTRFTSNYGTQALFYEPFNYECLREAHRTVYNKPLIPKYIPGNADLILSFGADFLETWISPVEFAIGFKQMHTFQNGTMGKLIYVGSRLSMTAANADLYIQSDPYQKKLLAYSLLDNVIKSGKTKNDMSFLSGQVKNFLEQNRPGQDFQNNINRAVELLLSSKSPLVLAAPEGINTQTEYEIAVAASYLNYALGAEGNTIDFSEPHALSTTAADNEINNFFSGITGDDVVFIHNCNPVYHQKRYADALKKAALVVYMGVMADETSQLSQWILPTDYYLESWGDYQPYPGVYNTIQPVTSRQYNSLSPAEIIIAIANETGKPILDTKYSSYALLVKENADKAATGEGSKRVAGQGRTESGTRGQNIQSTQVDSGELKQNFAHKDLKGGEPDLNSIEMTAQGQATGKDFSGTVTQGGSTNDIFSRGGSWKEYKPVSSGISVSRDLKITSTANKKDQFYFIPWTSILLFDGRLTNRGWINETADPIAFITWNSWIDINTSDAKKLQLKDGDILELSSPHGKVSAPVRISDDIALGCIALQYGYGHKALGEIAKERGTNAFDLLSTQREDIFLLVKKTGGYKRHAYLAATSSQYQRKILKWLPEEKLRGMNPGDGEKIILPLPEGYNPKVDLYPPHEHKNHRWAMVFDLQACIGCAACTVACYAENNIPVVGEEQCINGREQTWLKIVPYRKEETGGEFRKLGWIAAICQHCDSAPCEAVCPVFASVHNEEGLNAQVYNRCIGTRYCSNNCPYKVRRFNWFTPKWQEPLNQQLNPEVSVRTRGVMEKCTFCIQRIKNAEFFAKVNNKKIQDGDIIPACAQTCPTNAIIFGDLLDHNSEVYKLTMNDPRRYHLLEELNTKPAVTYLKRIEADLKTNG